MRVALVVVQLRLGDMATVEGMERAAAEAFGGTPLRAWPTGASFYFIGSSAVRGSKVKRVKFIDIPEGP